MRIFKGDGILDELYSRLGERLKVLRTSYMPEYLMETIRDNEDLKEALGKAHNVQNGQQQQEWLFLKEMAVLMQARVETKSVLDSKHVRVTGGTR